MKRFDIKSLLLGTLFGFILGGTVAVYADIGVLWDNTNTPIGTSSNPLYVQGV